MYNFGERLRQLRKSISLTQKQLATRISVAPSLISAYENGTRFPTNETLLQFSHIFHVSVDYLLGQEKYSYIFVGDLDEKQMGLLLYMLAHLRQQPK